VNARPFLRGRSVVWVGSLDGTEGRPCSGSTAMTESEWMTCTDPKKMLEFLRSKASDRKLRLFCCACLRRIWHLLREEHLREGIEVAERYINGSATSGELVRAVRTARKIYQDSGAAERAAYYATWISPSNAEAPAIVMSWSREAARYASDDPYPYRNVIAIESAAHAVIFRDVFGNPFRPVALDPSWLAWNDGTVYRIAQGIYEERKMPEGTLDSGRLAILHDALLDAGCSDEAILSHCRSSEDHVRGCWVVDLLLEKS
jgi:hypothetical protein